MAIKNAFDDACAQYYEDLEIARSKRSSKGKTAFDEELNGPAALHRPSPVGIAKAIKNDAELEGMRQAHLRCHSKPLKSVGLWLFLGPLPLLLATVAQDMFTFQCLSLSALLFLQGCCCTL